MNRSLEETFDLFAQAAELPTGDADLDGFAPRFLSAAHSYFEAANVHDRGNALCDLAVCVEVGLKRLLKLADSQAYEGLHEVTEPTRLPRSPMLTDLLNCPRLGLMTDSSSRCYHDFAWRARDLRNRSSHKAPAWSERELSQGFVDIGLTLLFATDNLRQDLQKAIAGYEHEHFARQNEAYLRGLVHRWREHCRRWVLLDAQELPGDEELSLGHLFASELPPNLPEEEESLCRDADRENRLPDEDADEATEEEADELPAADDRTSEERYTAALELRRGRVHELFDRVGRLVLIANAGAGKTTSLQHYAYLQAKALLDDPREFRPVPLYVELRYYRDGLWPLLRAAWQGDRQQPYDENRLRREFADGKWVLLLDGLNEVPSDRREQAFLDLEWLIRERGQGPLVITSRRDVPLERLRLPAFRLEPLTDGQIEEFLKRYFPQPRQAEAFAGTLRRNPRLWDWGRNPLQLWMLVQVGLKARAGLPENRGQLLRLFVGHLLKREESKGRQTPRDIKLDLLSEIGYQTRKEARIGFSRLQAWQIIGQRSAEMHYDVDSAAFVREVCDNHLLEDQGQQLAFAHEMYQEYFAACGLKGRYEENPGVVEELQGQAHWREPLVLMWGLLESPQSLFQRIVRDAPAVAAECLASAVEAKPDETEQLRQRVRKVNYDTASDEELQKVLEAIYILGDGKLLAHHLQERWRRKRLTGIGRQIAQAFTGDEPVLRATIDALEQLGKSANAFSEPLLQPLLGKEIVIPGFPRSGVVLPSCLLQPLLGKELVIPEPLQRQAADLWRTWRDSYKFAPIHLCLLALAFRLERLLAEEIDQPVGQLLKQGHWASALQAIHAFGLRERFPPEPIIVRMLEQGQGYAAVRGIQLFGLQPETFAENASASVRRLVDQDQWDAALGGIHAFGLTSIFLNTILDYLPRMDWPNLVKEFFWLKIIDAVAERLAELIQAGGDQREQILSSLARSGNWDTSWRADWARWLRNKTATVLVRRHADTHSAAALLAPLGLRREHIEHNRAQIERVERINEALAQTGGLPDDENLENLELFGYRRSECSDWIVAPGFRDFRISEQARGISLKGQGVRFRLVVERHPREDRLVLNATDLTVV